jgi:hypothetical protein
MVNDRARFLGGASDARLKRVHLLGGTNCRRSVLAVYANEDDRRIDKPLVVGRHIS